MDLFGTMMWNSDLCYLLSSSSYGESPFSFDFDFNGGLEFETAFDPCLQNPTSVGTVDAEQPDYDVESGSSLFERPSAVAVGEPTMPSPPAEPGPVGWTTGNQARSVGVSGGVLTSSPQDLSLPFSTDDPDWIHQEGIYGVSNVSLLMAATGQPPATSGDGNRLPLTVLLSRNIVVSDPLWSESDGEMGEVTTKETGHLSCSVADEIDERSLPLHMHRRDSIITMPPMSAGPFQTFTQKSHVKLKKPLVPERKRPASPSEDDSYSDSGLSAEDVSESKKRVALHVSSLRNRKRQFSAATSSTGQSARDCYDSNSQEDISRGKNVVKSRVGPSVQPFICQQGVKIARKMERALPNGTGLTRVQKLNEIVGENSRRITGRPRKLASGIEPTIKKSCHLKGRPRKSKAEETSRTGLDALRKLMAAFCGLKSVPAPADKSAKDEWSTDDETTDAVSARNTKKYSNKKSAAEKVDIKLSQRKPEEMLKLFFDLIRDPDQKTAPGNPSTYSLQQESSFTL